LAGAQTATVRCWEEHIEEAWATRNQKYLRGMVQFGLRQPILCRSTRPYVWRAALPAFVLESLMKHNVIRSAKDTIIAADN